LARAAGGDTTAFEAPARRALQEAGDRAYALSAYHTARRFYASALEAWPEAEPRDPELLIRYARVLNTVDITETPEIVLEAGELARAAGDLGRAAEAEMLMCEMYWLLGRRDEAVERLLGAEEVVGGVSSSYEQAYVMTNASRFWALAGNSGHAIRVGREALAMSEELGFAELQAHALNNVGFSRTATGDRGGLDDLEKSIEISEAINSVESA